MPPRWPGKGLQHALVRNSMQRTRVTLVNSSRAFRNIDGIVLPVLAALTSDFTLLVTPIEYRLIWWHWVQRQTSSAAQAQLSQRVRSRRLRGSGGRQSPSNAVDRPNCNYREAVAAGAPMPPATFRLCGLLRFFGQTTAVRNKHFTQHSGRNNCALLFLYKHMHACPCSGLRAST